MSLESHSYLNHHTDLGFLVDLITHLNDLNMSLQDKNQLFTYYAFIYLFIGGGVRRQFAEVASLPPSHGTQGSSSGSQTWWQTLLPTEPFYQPPFSLITGHKRDLFDNLKRLSEQDTIE